jgi:NAD(P)H dehydrogenase (quinone)
MYAITGVTGKVGGAVARNLLAAGRPVRAVLRDASKAQFWRDQGCDIALAEMTDAAALTTAFSGAEAVFILPPPIFDPAPGFPEIRAVIAAVTAALAAARPARVVHLSTVGAQATQPNLLSQQGLLEQALRDLTTPVSTLRPAWFMENFAWDVAGARDEGVLPSFLQPLDRAIPMAATADIARMAADLMAETRSKGHIVELMSAAVSPDAAAEAFAAILGRAVIARAVPRESWGPLFKGQGMRDPMPRIQMLDGFNEGWLTFEDPARVVQGSTTLETVLRSLV